MDCDAKSPNDCKFCTTLAVPKSHQCCARCEGTGSRCSRPRLVSGESSHSDPWCEWHRQICQRLVDEYHRDEKIGFGEGGIAKFLNSYLVRPENVHLVRDPPADRTDVLSQLCGVTRETRETLVRADEARIARIEEQYEPLGKLAFPPNARAWFGIVPASVILREQGALVTQLVGMAIGLPGIDMANRDGGGRFWFTVFLINYWWQKKLEHAHGSPFSYAEVRRQASLVVDVTGDTAELFEWFFHWLDSEIASATKQGLRTHRPPNLLLHGFFTPLFKLKSTSQWTKQQQNSLRVLFSQMRQIVDHFKVYEAVATQKWDWVAGIAGGARELRELSFPVFLVSAVAFVALAETDPSARAAFKQIYTGKKEICT